MLTVPPFGLIVPSNVADVSVTPVAPAETIIGGAANAKLGPIEKAIKIKANIEFFIIFFIPQIVS